MFSYNKIRLVFFALLVIVGVSCQRSANTDKIPIKEIIPANIIFPKGVKSPAENFTGTAWVNRLVQKDETGTYSIGNVVFEPGARTNWHLHPAGQTLIVIDGKGLYQEKGKPVRVIGKGDVIIAASNIEHWHGATQDSSLIHIAITNLKDGGVKWLQAVSNDEYNAIDK